MRKRGKKMWRNKVLLMKLNTGKVEIHLRRIKKVNGKTEKQYFTGTTWKRWIEGSASSPFFSCNAEGVRMAQEEKKKDE
jgi:hypothetical protein